MRIVNSQGVTCNLQSSKIDGIDLTTTDYESSLPFRIHVGSTSGGTAIKVDAWSGGTETFTGIAGAELSVICKKVYRTGTTATSLIALY